MARKRRRIKRRVKSRAKRPTTKKRPKLSRSRLKIRPNKPTKKRRKPVAKRSKPTTKPSKKRTSKKRSSNRDRYKIKTGAKGKKRSDIIKAQMRMMGQDRIDQIRGKSKKYRDKNRAIRKATADGKITKKEAKRLQKQGISEREIQRRYDKDFASRQRGFDRMSPGPSGYKNPANRPQYKPLTISRGAGKVYASPQRKAKEKPAPAPAAPRKATPTRPTNQYQSRISEMSRDLRAREQAFNRRATRRTPADVAQPYTQDFDLGPQFDPEAFNARLDEQRLAFDERFDQQRSDYENMMIQFRNEANQRALETESRYQSMMLAQQQAAEREAAQRAQAEAMALAQRQEAARQAAIGQRTSMANQMRAASAVPQLKFGAPDATGYGGTSGFRRRMMQGITLGGINV